MPAAHDAAGRRDRQVLKPPGENRALVLRLYEAFQAGNTDALGVLLADDFVNHNPSMMKGDLVAVHGYYKTPMEGAGVDF
jgi:hypothetical protein